MILKYLFSVQRIIGVASILCAIFVSFGDTNILHHFSDLLNLNVIVLTAVPILMFIGGIALIFFTLSYLWYRIFAFPYIFFIITLTVRFISLGNFWYPIAVILISFFLILNVIRRSQ